MLLDLPMLNAYAKNNPMLEEKIFSTATLDDEFAEDRVLIVMSNQASLQFNQYDEEDFDEIDCKIASNLSSSTEATLKTASLQTNSRSDRADGIHRRFCYGYR